MGNPFQGPPDPRPISQHYRIEWFKQGASMMLRVASLSNKFSMPVFFVSFLPADLESGALPAVPDAGLFWLSAGK